MRLRDVDCWVFDLDNTLYPASCRLFDQVDRRIGEYVQQLLKLDPVAARALQKQYFRDHRTTLNGLMIHHRIRPEDFLDFVHAIDLSPVAEDRRLDAALDRLPGRKVIYTNGSVRHAENVMGKLGVAESLKPLFVQGENISQTQQFVATGAAELGFIAYSQVIKNGRIGTGSGWIVPGQLRVTGDKAQGKKYYRHSGYPGGISETTFGKMQSRFPGRALEHAVKGMIPKNRLGRQLLTKLKVYAGPNHPHAAQKPAAQAAK